MSREQWMKRINNRLLKRNRLLVKTEADDPRWLRLGDYYLVSTKTNVIVCRHVNVSEFAPESMGPKRGGY
jgi:hypothetical protein